MTYVEAGGGRPDTVAFRVEDGGFVDVAGADQTGEDVLVSGGACKTDEEWEYLWSTYAIEPVSHCSYRSLKGKATDLAKTSCGLRIFLKLRVLLCGVFWCGSVERLIYRRMDEKKCLC